MVDVRYMPGRLGAEHHNICRADYPNGKQGAAHHNIKTLEGYFGALHLPEFHGTTFLQILRGPAALIQKQLK